jgi:sec-independent protein translocase protein TatA
MKTILLFGMPGGGELFFIVLIVIMLFGAKKIPELARGLGKGMREIKNATGDIQKEIRDGAREMNIPKNPLDIKQQVKDIITKETSAEDKKEKVEEENETHIEPKSIKRENSKTTNPTDSSETS